MCCLCGCHNQVKGVLNMVDKQLVDQILDGPYIMSARRGSGLGLLGIAKTDTQVDLLDHLLRRTHCLQHGSRCTLKDIHHKCHVHPVA
jgi:hypothetical protein